MKIATLIIVFAYNIIFAVNFKHKDYVYVTSAFWVNLCPIISTYSDLAVASLSHKGSAPYLQYRNQLQIDIIKAMRKQSILAVPDLTNSDAQAIQNFEYLSEVEEFLKTERDVFKNKRTLIPVIDTALIAPMASKDIFETRINVRIFTIESHGTLTELGKIKLTVNTTIDTSKGFVEIAKKFQEINQNLSTQLLESKGLKKIIQSAVFSKLINVPCLDLPSLLQGQGKENSYFLISNFVLKEKYPIARMMKVNFITNQERVSDLKNETIQFDFSKEMPVTFFGYILLPNNDILYLSENNLKINGAPMGYASNTFSYNSTATINLAGLQPGSIVTYVFVFADTYLLSRQRQQGVKPPLIEYPLAQDFTLTSTNKSDSWMFRISLPTRDSLYFLLSDSSNCQSKAGIFASQKIWTLNGNCIDSKNYSPRFLRVSTVDSYNKLYMRMSDSVYSKMSPSQPKRRKKRISQSDIETEVFKTIDFLQDSVRYFHVSYGPKAFVPENEDSVLQKRQSDCKSNSIVVLNRLHKLGISAVPALVHSYKKDLVNRRYPSFDAVNHMIVYSPELNWWIDPTNGKSPQWLIPGNLSGSTAILLYPDSVSLKSIPTNSYDLFIDTVHYKFEELKENMHCSVKQHMSYSSSFFFLNWIKSIKQEDLIEAVIGYNIDIDSAKVYNRRYSMDVTGSEKKRVILSKSYDVKNVNRLIGNTILLKWPETPIDPYDYLNDASDTTEINTENNYYEMVICTEIKSKKNVAWKNLIECQTPLFGLNILKVDNSHLNFRIYTKAGIIRSKDVHTFYKMMNSVGEFFNEEIAVN
jgi:hypothetical protein